MPFGRRGWRPVKLVLLTQYFPPETGAPQARLAALAQSFVRRGHSVTVLTAQPNYPVGRIYPGYGGLVRRERCDGVDVVRSFIYPTQSAGMVRRLANYGSFVASSAAVGTVLLRRADYLMVESPPIFLIGSAYPLSRLLRARLVFNVSDLWPESAVRLGVVREGSTAHRLTGRLEAFAYRAAHLVTGQAAGIVSSVRERFPAVRTYHLSNGVDTTLFDPVHASEVMRTALRRGSGCVALYAGLHGLAQGLGQLLDAAALLGPATDLRIALIGDGPEKQQLRRIAHARALTAVDFLDARPHHAIPAMVASADIIVVPLVGALPGAVPSKLYEAMASARPVVLVTEGEPARIVRDTDAGLVVPPGNPGALAGALAQLAADPELRTRLGGNGRAAVLERYDRVAIGDRFVRFLEEDLARNGVPTELSR